MSISSDYLSITRSTNGMSGMVSGLDTDSLVEALLMGQQSKIDKEDQKHSLMQYQQDAYRDVISKIDAFSTKFLSYSSSTSLISNTFFNQMTSTTSSSNFTVSGTSSAVDGDMRLKIEQLATTSTLSGGSISSVETISGAIDTDALLNANDSSVSFEITDTNGDKQTVSFTTDEVSKILQGGDGIDVTLDDGSTVKFTASAGKLDIDLGEGVTATVLGSDATGSSTTALGLEKMGLTAGQTSEAYDKKDGEFDVVANGFNTATKATAENTIDVNLDGVTKSIKLSELVSLNDDGTVNVNDTVANLNAKLDGLFGEGNIEFVDNGNGSFDITTKAGRQVTFGGSDAALAGFGLESGDTNVLSTSDKVLSVFGEDMFTDGVAEIIINGETITIEETDTISQMMSKVNGSDANVTMSFDSFTGTFSIQANESGAGFNIDFGGTDADGNKTGEGEDLLKAIMGMDTDATSGVTLNDIVEGNVPTPADPDNVTAEEQALIDAIGGINYEAGVNAKFELNGVETERSSNTFTAAGVTIELKEVHDDYENTTGDTITTERDVDSVMEGITSFIDEYNALIEELNSVIGEKYDKEYPPLTDAQRKEMSESEIASWEEKAKTGVLANDDIISDFLSSMRSTMYSGQGTNGTALWQIGIESSSDWTENGKLYIDEEKLRETLMTDPDVVRELFAGPDGLISSVAEVTKTYANTSSGSPGLLVQKAGVEGTATESNNTLYNWMQQSQSRLESLEYNYTLQSDRFWAQFNAMEVVLSTLSSQSAWLSQQFAY